MVTNREWLSTAVNQLGLVVAREWPSASRFLKEKEEEGDIPDSDLNLSVEDVQITSYVVNFSILAVFLSFTVLRTLHAKAFLKDLRKGSRDTVSDGMRARPVKSLQICSVVTCWAFVSTVALRAYDPELKIKSWTFIPTLVRRHSSFVFSQLSLSQPPLFFLLVVV